MTVHARGKRPLAPGSPRRLSKEVGLSDRVHCRPNYMGRLFHSGAGLALVWLEASWAEDVVDEGGGGDEGVELARRSGRLFAG